MSDDDARLRALEKRLAESEERSKRAVDFAEKASRSAADSLARLDGLGAGLISHLQRLDDKRARDAEASEQVRKAAATAHAKRFDALQRDVQRIADQGMRGKWILGTVVAVITTLSMQAVEAIKIIYAPRAPTTEVAR